MPKHLKQGDGHMEGVEQQLDDAQRLLDRAEQLERRADELARRADELEGRLRTDAGRPTDITIVLDRSGSMQATKADAIGSYNSFLAEQRKVAGRAAVSLVQFDDEYEPVYTGRPLADAPELTDDTYRPRGMTALLDAVGRTIVRTDERLAKATDRPELVIFVILTDGMENASREFSRAKVFKLIREREQKHNWEFVFLGANQDAIAEAGSIGIGASRAVTYDVRFGPKANELLARKLGRYRISGRPQDLDWSTKDRREVNPDA